MTDQSEISIEEAAHRLGTTVIAVLMHIKQKRLRGAEVDGRWYVNVQGLEALCGEGSGASPQLCGGGCSGCSSKG